MVDCKNENTKPSTRQKNISEECSWDSSSARTRAAAMDPIAAMDMRTLGTRTFCSQGQASLYPERGEHASKSVDVVRVSRYPHIVECQHLCTRSGLHILKGISCFVYRVDSVFARKLVNLLAHHLSIPHIFFAILQQNHTKHICPALDQSIHILSEDCRGTQTR